MDKEAVVEECKTGWLSVEHDFKARLLKPELVKRGKKIVMLDDLFTIVGLPWFL